MTQGLNDNQDLHESLKEHRNPESAYDLELTHSNPELDEALDLGIYYCSHRDDFFVNVSTTHGSRLGYSVVSIPLGFFKNAIDQVEKLRNQTGRCLAKRVGTVDEHDNQDA